VQVRFRLVAVAAAIGAVVGTVFGVAGPLVTVGPPALASADDTTWGQVVGYIGGSTYSPAMWDNVFYSDH
jgi:hypothetical protein